MSTPIPIRSRKSEHVYRSPQLNEPSPYEKQKTEPTMDMDIDAKDQEAGTILMALAQHAKRILNHPQHLPVNKSNHSTMSIRNLLDNESTTPKSTQPSHPFYESRRHNQLTKGFQVRLIQRQQPNNQDYNKTSFRHPSKVGKPTLNHQRKSFLKRNSTHIHISYRIHAHRVSMNMPSSLTKYEYPSAFRPTNHRWKENSLHRYQQDA